MSASTPTFSNSFDQGIKPATNLTESNDLAQYYLHQTSDELVAQYKSGELTEYISNIIAEILQNRGIDTTKIDRLSIRPEKKPFHEVFLDFVGFIGYVFGIVAPLFCALFECYLWAVQGSWPGFSTQDLLYYLHIVKDQHANYYIYLGSWQELTNLANHVIAFVMNMSLIFSLGLFGFIIFEIVDLMHTAVNKRKKRKTGTI